MPTRREVLSLLSVVPAGLAMGRSQSVNSATGTRDASFDPWVEVHAANVAHNVAEVRRRVGGRPVLAVIKNNGYGAGVANIARLLEPLEGIDGFAVIKVQEAVTLRDAGIRAPILLMGPYSERELDEIVARDIMPMVYRPLARELERASTKHQRRVRVHFCIDTGIGRVGVPFREAETLLADLAARPFIDVAGTMMTFAEDPVFDVEQLDRFNRLCGSLARAGVSLGRRHAASSFTLFQRPDAFLDMVRPGMALFGVYSEQEFRGLGILALRPALALKARVAYVKQLQPGDSAGYNRAYKATRPVWIGTLPVGHADGLPRGIVGNGRVRVGQSLYPIIGSVSASHSMIEIGTDRTVEIGDEATFFDWQDGSRPEDLGSATRSSVYDLLMHLNPLLPRRIV